MAESLSTRLLELDDRLTKIGCENTGVVSERAFSLARSCGIAATFAVLRALKETEAAYQSISAALKEASDAADAASEALSDVGKKIAATAKALDLAARLFKVIVEVLAL